MPKKPAIISLYTGAGGLDYGFEAAGFETAVALEMDRDCVRTLPAESSLAGDRPRHPRRSRRPSFSRRAG